MKKMPMLGAVLVGLSMLPSLTFAQNATPVASPAISSASSTSCTVGRQADGTIVLPTDQVLDPAGTQIEFLGRPVAAAINPNGKTAAFMTGYVDNMITIVDLATNAAIQEFDAGSKDAPAAASYGGIAYSAAGDALYASDSNGSIVIAAVAADGTLTLADRIKLATSPIPANPSGSDSARPGGLAVSADGKTLFVALNRNNTLGVFDLGAKKLTKEIPVGNAPYGVTIAGDKAYVTNQAGRPAGAGDTTNDSGGTKIVSDPVTGGPVSGTVSVIDLAKLVETGTIAVGLQPTNATLDGRYLFVTNSNSDTISVIDTATDRVAKTISVQAFPGAPFGSSPNAVAMIQGGHLVVSLGRNNALAVYTWQGPSEAVNFEGLIPTGWYPASIAVDTAHTNLIVANAKGVGSLGPEKSAGPEAVNPTGNNVHSNKGSVSIIPFPTTDDLAAGTGKVFQNNQWTTRSCSAGMPSTVAQPGDAATHAIPVRVGDPSLIKHVFYIIKENRTYDQVFGDDPRGNGDPSLVEFGKTVTPNHHKLATDFPLLDNLYDSGSLSADGHQWSTQAYADDYIEKAFGDFARSYPFDGGDALTYAPTGFLWDNALRHGQDVRVYGEYANGFAAADPFGDKVGPWAAWWRDYLTMSGQASGAPALSGAFQASSDVPSLDALLNRDYPIYSQNIPDVYRAEIFHKEFQQYVTNGNLPALTIMTLPADHTAGTAPDFPTPQAHVADNDLALGRIVEEISKSPYWKDSAIFVIEDDAQNGVDHVDGHRTVGMAISPYVKRGIVDNSYYTQIDMVRTIEQILGLPPMNQMDLAAAPMWNLFTDTPDLTPYTAVANQIPLDEMNPAVSAASGAQVAWAQASAAMGFDDIATPPDSQDENLLNRAIWYSARGFNVPYPGDARVLMPWEVAPAPTGEEGAVSGD